MNKANNTDPTGISPTERKISLTQMTKIQCVLWRVSPTHLFLKLPPLFPFVKFFSFFLHKSEQIFSFAIKDILENFFLFSILLLFFKLFKGHRMSFKK